MPNFENHPSYMARCEMIKHLRIFLFLIIAVGFATIATAVADDLAQTIRRAEQGDAEAQYDLGLIYSKGTGVGQDYRKAEAFFAKAAESGHGEAQYQLACLYNAGLGVEQDRPKAHSLFVAAADHGSAEAQYFLARMYAKGKGLVKKNYRKAAYWYGQAARQGHSEAGRHLQNLCSDRPSVCGDGR